MKNVKKVAAILILSIMLIGVLSLAVGCLPMTTDPAATSDNAVEQANEPTGFAAIFAQYGTWVWLGILGVAFYFLLIRPQRMRTKKSQDLMSSLVRGDEIVTAGGFHGRIKDIRDDVIVVTIASGVDVKISKASVSKKVSDQKS